MQNMTLLEVNTPALARRFLLVNVQLQQHVPGYIRPLDKDVLEVFHPEKNKAFRHGEVVRWILQNETGEDVGRIAAFVNSRYKNKGDQWVVGGFGFFECINNQPAANQLLDAARNWLLQKGCAAMDGPINFGERDKWWGLLIEGFEPPLYGVTFNPPYYQSLLENYGCQVFYYQNCWSRSVAGRLEPKFYAAHQRLSQQGGYHAERVRKNNLEKYARDFTAVYNKAWASHEGNKEMADVQALKIFKAMKPVMDEDLAWFAYYQNEPIAFYINLPDLNQAFRYLHGRFDWWGKLQFLWYRSRGVITRFVGIVFGVVPEHQGKGADYYLIVEAANVIQAAGRYQTTELQWQGDFNPKINAISVNLGFSRSRRLAVFRYLFDRSLPFERHPMLH